MDTAAAADGGSWGGDNLERDADNRDIRTDTNVDGSHAVPRDSPRADAQLLPGWFQ